MITDISEKFFQVKWHLLRLKYQLMRISDFKNSHFIYIDIL
jgi:hypothetical protein